MPAARGSEQILSKRPCSSVSYRRRFGRSVSPRTGSLHHGREACPIRPGGRTNSFTAAAVYDRDFVIGFAFISARLSFSFIGTQMPVRAKALGVASVCIAAAALLPVGGHAEGIDTEHLLQIHDRHRRRQRRRTGTPEPNHGTVVQSRRQLPRHRPGSRRLNSCPSRTSGSNWKGTFRHVLHLWRPSFCQSQPVRGAGCFALIRAATGFWIERRIAFGLTLAAESHVDRVDETTAARVRNNGTQFTPGVRSRAPFRTSALWCST